MRVRVSLFASAVGSSRVSKKQNSVTNIVRVSIYDRITESIRGSFVGFNM